MAAECQRAKTLLQDGDDRPEMSLNMLRISFFQHIYYENQRPGGTKSLLYLREAITIAQIMGLHRKSSGAQLSQAEQQMRRRILWLLFVTERGVAMLHRLPVMLTCRPGFPLFDAADEADEAHILPAFKKLVNLFWIFDQSGAFDILQDDNSGVDQNSCFDYLQRRLQEVPLDSDHSNDVQKADICVTKSWMQAVLWRASMRRSRSTCSSGQKTSTLSQQPYCIAKEFLGIICRLPKSALEAHGPTIELKIFEIGNALMDALSSNFHVLRGSVINCSQTVRPVDMLIQLQKLLASSRGGNKTLLSLLCSRITEMGSCGSPGVMNSPSPSPPPQYARGEQLEAPTGDRHWSIEQDGPGPGPVSEVEDQDQDQDQGNRALTETMGMSYSLQSPDWFGLGQDLDMSMPNIDAASSVEGMFANAVNELASENELWAGSGWPLDLSSTSHGVYNGA